MLLSGTAAAGAATTGLLGQADRVGAALNRLAGQLAHTANDVGTTLNGLAEEGEDAGHFYYCVAF